MNDTVIINNAQLESLRELNEPGEDDIVTELIDIFLAQSPEILNNLEIEVANKNADKVEKLAHKLKGSCANLGAEKLQKLCETLEDLGRSKDLEPQQDILTKIQESYKEACQILNTEWRRPAA